MYQGCHNNTMYVLVTVVQDMFNLNLDHIMRINTRYSTEASQDNPRSTRAVPWCSLHDNGHFAPVVRGREGYAYTRDTSFMMDKGQGEAESLA